VIQDTVTFTALNAVQRVPVRVLDSLGNTIDGSPISVTSSFPAMIAVTTDGSLKALQVGATTLTVRSAVDSARLTAVVRQQPARIALNVDSIAFDAFDEKLLINPVLLDSLGSRISDTVPRLAISDTSVAR